MLSNLKDMRRYRHVVKLKRYIKLKREDIDMLSNLKDMISEDIDMLSNLNVVK